MILDARVLAASKKQAALDTFKKIIPPLDL